MGASTSSGVSEAKPEAADAGKKQRKTRLSHNGVAKTRFLPSCGALRECSEHCESVQR